MNSVEHVAKETMVALDAMDEKLRRLGYDDAANGDGSAGATVCEACNTTFPSATQYLTALHHAHEARVKLMQEKRYQDFLAQGQCTERGGTVEGGDVEQRGEDEQSGLIEMGGAQKLLHNEAAKAAMRAHEALQKSKERDYVSEQRAIVISLSANDRAPDSTPQPSYLAVTRTQTEFELPPALSKQPTVSTASDRSTIESDVVESESAMSFCHTISRGIVDLAIVVSDSRYLPAMDLAGQPVRRTAQDLAVSQWRQWVEELVLNPTRGGCDVGEHTQAVGGVMPRSFAVEQPVLPHCASDGNKVQGDDNGTMTRGHVSSGQAEEELNFAAQQRDKLLQCTTQKLLHDVAELLSEEGKRLRKIAVEEVRRRYDEQHHISCSGETGAAAEGHGDRPPFRENVLPRWPQRLPPAGCFVYGDALSGSYLLCHAIEQVMQVHLQSSQRQSVTGDEANNTNTVVAAGGTLSTKGAPATKTSTTRSVDEAATRASQGIGVALAEEGGVRRILVTPRTLLGMTANASPTRTHTSATGKVRSTAAGKMAAGMRLSAEEEERKEAELLIEAITRELVAVHVQNVCVACKWLDLLPSVNSTAAACVASSPRRGNTMSLKLEDKATTQPDPITTATQESETRSLSCLLLIGFPESETFYQQLTHELTTAMEAAEAELAAAQLRRQAEVDMEDNAVTSQRRRQDGAPHATSRAATSVRARGDVSSKERSTKVSKVQGTADDAATALAAQQNRQAIPPLCVLGYFIEYDQVTRLRRIQGAYVFSDVTTSSSTTTTTTALPQGSTLAGGHVVAAAAATTATSRAALRAPPATLSVSTASTLYHTVFHPEGSYVGRGGVGAAASSSSMSGSAAVTLGGKDGKVATVLAHRTGSTAAPTPTAIVASMPLTAIVGVAQANKPATSLITSRRRESVTEVWSTAELRHEMLTQETRARHWRTTWGAACAPASGSTALKRFATTVTVNGRDRQRRRSFARRAPSNAEAVVSTGRRGSHAHISVEQLSDAERSCGKLSTDTFVFPRVLFFATTADVSDAHRTPVTAAAVTPTEFASHAVLTFLPDDSTLDMERVAGERAEYLSFMLQGLYAATNPATSRLTNETLTVRQLQAPLRLSDHRLPSEVCAELLQTYQVYTTKLLPSSLWPGHERSTAHDVWGQATGHVKTHAPETAAASAPCAMPITYNIPLASAEMRAEIEVFRCFALFAASCLRLVGVEAFPPELWGPRHSDTGPCFTSTMHYTSIDQSYAKCVTELQESTTSMWSQLRLRCALLVRLAIDNCIASVAEMLDAVSEMVMRSYFAPRVDAASLTDAEHLGESRCLSLVDLDGSINLHLDAPHSSLGHAKKLTEARAAVKHSFSTSARRFSFEDATALVMSLTCEEGTASTFWTVMVRYIDDVEQLATSVLLDFIDVATAEVHQCSTTMSDETLGQLSWSQLVPRLVQCIVARAFAPQRSVGRGATSSSCAAGTACEGAVTTPVQCAADPSASPHGAASCATSMTLSPFLARCTLLVRHVSTCFSEMARCSREWLEALYKLALTAPREGPSPITRRPVRVAQLFSPPTPTSAAAAPSTLSRLSTTELRDGEEVRYEQAFYDLCLASFAVCNGPLVSQSELLLCAILAQLGHLCSACEDTTAALFDVVHFASPPPPPLPCSESAMDICDVLPIALYNEVHCAPCRDPTQQSLPFLTLQELTSLTDIFCDAQSVSLTPTRIIAATVDVKLPAPQRRPSSDVRYVNAREFCLSMLAHRLCLCGRASTTLVHDRSRSCFPSAREIRQCMAYLPDKVTSRTVPMIADDEMPSRCFEPSGDGGCFMAVPPLCGNAPSPPANQRALSTQSSEREGDDRGAGALRQWTLWRTLCSQFRLTAHDVVMRPYPSLSSVLKFLCFVPGSVETSVERMFHALAGLRHVSAVRRVSVEGMAVVADMDAVSALAADQVGLSVDEFAAFFADMQRSSMLEMTPVTEQLICATGTDGLRAQEIRLEVDAQMLLQMEGRNVITLSLLLASHWGRALVTTHFA